MDSPTAIAEVVHNTLMHDTRIAAAYLLGSAVRGTLRSDSDIDIALLPQANAELGSAERLALGEDLAACLGRDVDIGVLSSRNLVYAMEVITGGRRVFARDQGATELTEATLLGMWVRFNEERQEVMNAYTAG